MVRGRLWRASNPALEPADHDRLARDLMTARRSVREALKTGAGLAAARKSVNAAKIGLGERGPVWWSDGAPDFNRHMARNTPYADWAAGAGDAPGPR